MAKFGPIAKPSMAQMPTLLWMADHPQHRLVSSSVLTHASHNWKEPDGSRVANAPEVSRNLAVHRLLQSGWIRQANKEGEKWAWYDHPYVITKEGIEVAEKYRAKYEKHAARNRAVEKEIERFVIVKNNRGYGNNRKYGFIARVKRETKKRLYVERIKTEHDNSYGYYESLHGNHGDHYVDREDVTMDNATLDIYAAVRKVESAHIEWLEGIAEQEQSEIDKIRERYDERRKQNQFSFEDEVREALEQVKQNVA